MFDYDGVLMDSNHCPMEYYALLSKTIGTREFRTWNECREVLEANYRDSLKKLGVTEPERMRIAHELFNNNMDMWKDLELFPKIKQVLTKLKQQGYKLAIISNNHNDIIMPDLKKHNIHDLFDHIIDSSIGLKPDTTQLIHCLKITNIYPDQAVMFDDMDGGIIAAKKAKLKKAIGVSYGYQLPERLHMADVIINKPEEILDVVE